jgi:hypothetical protein
MESAAAGPDDDRFVGDDAERAGLIEKGRSGHG